MYELHVKQKIEEGLADIEAGRTLSHEALKAEIPGNAAVGDGVAEASSLTNRIPVHATGK